MSISMRHFNIGKLSQPDWPVKRNKQQGHTKVQGKDLVSATKFGDTLTMSMKFYMYVYCFQQALSVNGA